MINLPIDNAFNLEVKARQAITINALEDTQSLKELKNDKYLVLGSATNMIMNELYEGTIIKVSMDDIEQVSNGTLSVGAGLPWGKLISYCLDNNLFGIENLTLIPGLVGASPVQNIGAYGVEVSSVVESVTCYNFETQQIEILTKSECNFSYRQSIFQTKQYLILSVQFRFNKLFKPDLSYPSLVQFLEQENINSSEISPAELSSCIQAIRESKLPSPSVTPNVGSIFKNPIVESDSIDLDFLKGHRWDAEEGQIKLSAARLLETVMPSINIPPSLGFYEKYSLVLINRGGAVFSEVIKLLKDIQDKVQSLYGIDLEIEPEILGS
jgi:UDP-N-acetylmuramate dehydrogenase